MLRGSLREQSRNWELRLSTWPKEFFLQQKIGTLPANSSDQCRNRLSRYIREAAPRRKTGQSKTGLACFLQAAVSQTSNAWWSSQARQTKLRRTDWNANGRIAMFVSPGTCLCQALLRSLRARHSSGTTAEFRISRQPPAPIAFSSLARPIRMFGRQETTRSKFSGRRAENLMISESKRFKQLSPSHFSEAARTE